MPYILERIQRITLGKLSIYIIIYLLAGMAMNGFGAYAEIAKFEHWWQIITCYGLYMIPISILMLGHSFFNQYCYGLFAMGLLEFAGYTFETSYIYPNNILIQWFGPYTFALGMTLFFALYFPLGNILVDYIYRKLFKQKKPLH